MNMLNGVSFLFRVFLYNTVGSAGSTIPNTEMVQPELPRSRQVGRDFGADGPPGSIT